jgi:NodT family efflux transporter outer membrane factor (OMF) lipoprotein
VRGLSTRRSGSRTALCGALAAALAACSPPRPRPFAPPALPTPRALGPGIEGPVRFSASDPASFPWETVGGPGLARIAEEVERASPDLRAAAARVRAARALAVRSARERLPRLDGTAGASVARSGEAAGDREAFDAGLEASWEADLFGRLAHARDAAIADAHAVEEDRRALVLSLQAEAALAWFDWAAALREEAVARETDELLARTRNLMAERLRAGVSDELAVHRVDVEVMTARALVPVARLAAAKARHRLAVLLGRPPDALADGRDGVAAPPPDGLPLPAEVPLGIPGALVRRRPDVRAAERRLAAGHRRVLEAWKAFYPTVTIDGTAGLSSLDLADLFTGRALLAVLAPRLRVPLLDAGRLEADLLEREARRDEAAAQWVAVALQAFAEVADAAAGVTARREALDRRRDAVASAVSALDLANRRFPEVAGYLEVIEAHRSLTTAQLAEVREEAALREETVRLALALAGGFGDPQADPCAPCPPVFGAPGPTPVPVPPARVAPVPPTAPR